MYEKNKSCHDGPRCSLPFIAIEMPKGYGATAARRTPDEKVGSSNLSVHICSYQRGHSDITKFGDLMWHHHHQCSWAATCHRLLMPATRARVSARVLTNKTVWPSGLRRWLKAPFRAVGSSPTAVSFVHLVHGLAADAIQSATMSAKKSTRSAADVQCDTEGIRALAGRAQWISSPSP